MDEMNEDRLYAIAARQLGLVTRDQARSCLTRKQLESWIRQGRLIRVRRGVYRMAGAPELPDQELMAACLVAGVAARASHRSASEVWGLPGVMAYQPELVVPWPLTVRLPGVHSHQTRYLPPSHVTIHHGVPVTSPARTVVDLSAFFGEYLLGRITDHVTRQRLATIAELHEAYALLATPGRHRLTVMRAVLDERPIDSYHPGDSNKELDLLSVILEAGFPRPVPQFQVTAGGKVYLLDYAYPETKIGLEYEGSDHATVSALHKDSQRVRKLQLAGWLILLFTKVSTRHEIVGDLAAAFDARGVCRTTPSQVQTREVLE
jgi:hypothetical protein